MSYSNEKSASAPLPPYEQTIYDSQNQSKRPNDDPLDRFPVVLKWLIKIGIVILASGTIVLGVIGTILNVGTLAMVSGIIIM